MIENFFTEERRIKRIVNNAVNTALCEERKKAEAEKDQMKREEIIRYSKLNIPVEKIIEVTDYPKELVEEVLNKNK